MCESCFTWHRGNAGSARINAGLMAVQHQDIYPRLVQCWPTVCDAGPALNQPWMNVSCLLRIDSRSPASPSARWRCWLPVRARFSRCAVITWHRVPPAPSRKLYRRGVGAASGHGDPASARGRGLTTARAKRTSWYL